MYYTSKRSSDLKYHAFQAFLEIKKSSPKNLNSSKFWKKSSKISKKNTSETGNSNQVELVLNWVKTPFLGRNLKRYLQSKNKIWLSNISKRKRNHYVALFWNISKTYGKKPQNSSKILRKLKQKFQTKTQKTSAPVELSWRKIVQKKPD